MTEPIGRPVRVACPDGLEAQAVTTGPNPGKARIVIERVDGGVFDVTAFTAKLLANTAATGAAFEIMPSVGGEDGFGDRSTSTRAGTGATSCPTTRLRTLWEAPRS